jgi:hypothetical protein
MSFLQNKLLVPLLLMRSKRKSEREKQTECSLSSFSLSLLHFPCGEGNALDLLHPSIYLDLCLIFLRFL